MKNILPRQIKRAMPAKPNRQTGPVTKLLIGAVLCALMTVSASYADLDVDILPGTPLDRLRFRPSPELTRPSGPAPKPGDGETGPAVGIAEEYFSYVEALKFEFNQKRNPIFASGITTVDAQGHTGFDNWHDHKDVMPPLTLQQKYVLYGDILRGYLYGSSRISWYEIGAQFQTIGIPSMQHAWAVQGSDWRSRVGVAVREAYDSGKGLKFWDRLSPEKDVALPLKTGVRTLMLYEIIIGDLASGHNYFNDHKYLRRIKMIRAAPEVQDIILKLADSQRYLVVHRNACAMLAWIGDERARAALLKAAKGEDISMRNRAILDLLLFNDEKIVPWLLMQLRHTDDPFFRALLLYALGQIQDKRVLEPLLAYSSKAFNLTNDVELREFCWSMLPALARHRAADERAMKLYEACLKSYTNTDPLYQIALLGAAASGSEKHLKTLKRMVPSKKYPLLHFAPGAKALAFELLTNHDIFKDGRDFRQDIFLAEVAADQFRFAALYDKKFTAKDLPSLLKWATDSAFTNPMKGLALVKLLELDVASASGPAADAVQAYAKLNQPTPYDGAHIPLALKILFTQNKLPPKLLLKVLEKAYAAIIFSNTLELRMHGIKHYPPFPPPVLDHAVKYAAELNDKKCLSFVLKLLQKDSLHKDVMIWNLKAARHDKLNALLVAHLEHSDGWIRYCAAESLEAISGKAIDCNWLNSHGKDYAAGLQFWRKWLKDQKEK
ncbi:HEAT repeat domain-containing protein [Planctomycetota bacterium]